MHQVSYLLLLLLVASPRAQNLDDVLKSLLKSVTQIATDVTEVKTRVTAIEALQSNVKCTQLVNLQSALNNLSASASQYASKQDIVALTSGVDDLKASANRSAVQLERTQQCCETGAKQRLAQFQKLLVEVVKSQSRALTTTPTQKPTTGSPSTPPPPQSVQDCGSVAGHLYYRTRVDEGVYDIVLQGGNTERVYCTRGGVVVQWRDSGKEKFDRNYRDYESGFGHADAEHQLGLRTLHQLTSVRQCRFRADFILDDTAPSNIAAYKTSSRDGDGASKYFEFQQFQVSSATQGYKLNVSGLSTNLLNTVLLKSLKSLNGLKFSAQDNGPQAACANALQTAWWFGSGCNTAGTYRSRESKHRCSKSNKVCAQLTPYTLQRTEFKLFC